jgi:hypothetical protein
MSTPTFPKYRNRKAASQYLLEVWGLTRSPNYLAKLAVIGGGPAFRKANRTPLYDDPGLDAYATSIIGPLVRSTSQAQSIAQTKATANAESHQGIDSRDGDGISWPGEPSFKAQLAETQSGADGPLLARGAKVGR